MSVAATLGALLPDIRVAPPGPESRGLAGRLARVESRDVTYLGDDWPVFWREAAGANVRDVDDNVYVDLTSAFGVALLGHACAPLLAALRDDGALVHGMGDVHPPEPKVELLERLAALAPWSDARVVLGGSGAEAVEAALKTTLLATGRPGIVAFEGGYHGLTLGPLAATERKHFRGPFRERVYGGVGFVPFPDASSAARALEGVEALLRRGAPNGDPVGTVLVEPVQARGGAKVPPDGFMAELGTLARSHGALVVADEIFTGLGRCGAMFASERVGLEPDVVCIGKVLGGGLPISACMAPAGVMDAWPASTGEAIHTSTFIGHPLACRSALGVLDALEADDVAARADRLGQGLMASLRDRLEGPARLGEVRGLGLLIGVAPAGPDGDARPGSGVSLARAALGEGLLALPAGDRGEVLELAPPVVLTDEQAAFAVDRIGALVEAGR